MMYRVGLALLALLVATIGVHQTAQYAIHEGVFTVGDTPVAVDNASGYVVDGVVLWKFGNVTVVKNGIIVGKIMGINVTPMTCKYGVAHGKIVVENATMITGKDVVVRIGGREIHIVDGTAIGCIYYAR